MSTKKALGIGLLVGLLILGISFGVPELLRSGLLELLRESIMAPKKVSTPAPTAAEAAVAEPTTVALAPTATPAKREPTATKISAVTPTKTPMPFPTQTPTPMPTPLPELSDLRLTTNIQPEDVRFELNEDFSEVRVRVRKCSYERCEIEKAEVVQGGEVWFELTPLAEEMTFAIPEEANGLFGEPYLHIEWGGGTRWGEAQWGRKYPWAIRPEWLEDRGDSSNHCCRRFLVKDDLSGEPLAVIAVHRKPDVCTVHDDFEEGTRIVDAYWYDPEAGIDVIEEPLPGEESLTIDEGGLIRVHIDQAGGWWPDAVLTSEGRVFQGPVNDVDGFVIVYLDHKSIRTVLDTD